MYKRHSEYPINAVMYIGHVVVSEDLPQIRVRVVDARRLCDEPKIIDIATRAPINVEIDPYLSADDAEHQIEIQVQIGEDLDSIAIIEVDELHRDAVPPLSFVVAVLGVKSRVKSQIVRCVIIPIGPNRTLHFVLVSRRCELEFDIRFVVAIRLPARPSCDVSPHIEVVVVVNASIPCDLEQRTVADGERNIQVIEQTPNGAEQLLFVPRDVCMTRQRDDRVLVVLIVLVFRISVHRLSRRRR